MDYEASLDQIQDKERTFKEEVVTLNEQLKGKDQAIKALSTSLMEKAQDHEALSTRFNDFKNQLILENSFHSQYGAKQIIVTGTILKKTTTVEVVISFLKDSTFEEEFFLVIESKDFNPETGVKDKRLIPIDDIDEIEHVSGTEFEVRYETEVMESQPLAPIKQALL